MWDIYDDPFLAGKYKSKRIKGLTEKLTNIKFAVGDRPSDAFAYSKNNIKTVIISEDFESANDIIFVHDWNEIYHLNLDGKI